MVTHIGIPKLGMSMVDATLVKWKAKEGDRIEKGDVILTIETEKITWDVEAEAAGFLYILVEEGSKAPVGMVVGLIAGTKEELETLQKEPPREMFTTVRELAEASSSEPERVEIAAQSTVRIKKGEYIRISPVARKMAEENMIDISVVEGSGPGGRIVREDIDKEIEAKREVGVTHDEYQGRKVKTTIPLKGMRAAIAEHMSRSLAVAAQLSFMGEMDMTEMVKLRETLLSQEAAIGTRITYTEIFAFAIARALKDNPTINCSLIDNEIKIWEDINIGVAVAVGEEGLIVPVVRNADRKSLVEISKEMKLLENKAREGKLMPDEVAGGTFTLTTLGRLSVANYSTPIINQPESAILATGKIVDKPVGRDGQIVLAPIMTYSLTADHRVINGYGAEKFLTRLKELLENPGLLLI